MKIEQLISEYGLQPHPEGGYYRQTYKSAEAIPPAGLPSRFSGERVFSTAIYFLLTATGFSAFHRIRSDEVWHFYTGGPLLIHVIFPSGRYEQIRLGKDGERQAVFQAVVPAGCWFASECAPGTEFSLVGCTVAPGFEFADFELAERENLARQFPGHRELIHRLTR